MSEYVLKSIGEYNVLIGKKNKTRVCINDVRKQKKIILLGLVLDGIVKG